MLMATISDELLPQVLGCRTAQELWNALAKTFASTAQARMMSLHYELATAKKGSSSITAYFQRIKQISATLAAAKQPLKHFEFTSYLLADLGPEYDPFITSITTRVEPLTMDDLLGHLLAHEMRIEKNTQPEPLLANLASAAEIPLVAEAETTALGVLFLLLVNLGYSLVHHAARIFNLLEIKAVVFYPLQDTGPLHMGPLSMAQCPPQGLSVKYVAKWATQL